MGFELLRSPWINLQPCLNFVRERIWLFLKTKFILKESRRGLEQIMSLYVSVGWKMSSGVPAYWNIQWVDENTHWSPWSIPFSHPTHRVFSLTKRRQGWRLIHGDLISSKPISYRSVRQARAKFRAIKIVHRGTKQKKLLQTSEMKFIQSFQSQKKIHAEKIFPLPPEKNGPSLTLIIEWRLWEMC